MNRYMKYSKNYRLSIICVVIAIAAIIWVLAATFSFSSPAATMSLFFAPTLMGASLMLAINFWYKAENGRFGWDKSGETESWQ